MLLYNRGYRGTLDGVTPHGVIINPSSIHAPSITRRETYESRIVLFDPQLYLMDLNKDNYEKTFLRLGTYPWFTDSPPVFNSQTSNIRDWTTNLSLNKCGNIGYPDNDSELRSRVLDCLRFQDSNVDATHLIIPTPLVQTQEDQFSKPLKWIRAGLQYKDMFNKPILASIALSDSTLLHTPLEQNELLQTLLDTLTALKDIDGFYIVIERKDLSMHIADFHICRALLELSHVLSNEGEKAVFVNFADVFGAVCLAAGATGFGSGYTNKEKRLNLTDFAEGFGIPLPRYFSSHLIGDYFAQRDLEKIPVRRLRRWLEQELTLHSQSLFHAISIGQGADSVPAWQERSNNVTAATKHRIQSLVALAEKINAVANRDEKIETVMEWLEVAEERNAYLYRTLDESPLTEDGRHITVWHRAMEAYIKNHP